MGNWEQEDCLGELTHLTRKSSIERIPRERTICYYSEVNPRPHGTLITNEKSNYFYQISSF